MSSPPRPSALLCCRRPSPELSARSLPLVPQTNTQPQPTELPVVLPSCLRLSRLRHHFFQHFERARSLPARSTSQCVTMRTEYNPVSCAHTPCACTASHNSSTAVIPIFAQDHGGLWPPKSPDAGRGSFLIR